LTFSVGDSVVYPAHGVGRVFAVETQEVAGISLEVYVITFDHEKMTLRVPTRKAVSSGLRPLASGTIVTQALTTLKGRARVKRTMWSRRAQEYEAKISPTRNANCMSRRLIGWRVKSQPSSRSTVMQPSAC